MRGLLAVVCALGCMVGAGQAQANNAEAQQVALAPIERLQAADGYPSQPAATLAPAAPLSEGGSTRTELPGAAMLFAFAFWSVIWLMRRSRGDRPAPMKPEPHAGSDLLISHAPVASEGMPPSQVERRRAADRRSQDTPERRG
ncbi:MAG: hypothetical protein DI587_14725 [Variovorax paradoxus]|nr:MAG: hypothetical protein DI583_14725 [Variovorax paradoxus]PZQ09662.1 MAG: hypothetical protein DI587_14725 [Variovorax paradoxus]